MTEVSAQDMQSIVGPELGVTGGGAAGLGIHYKIKGDTKIDSPTAGVEAELDEKSLQKAEMTTGATRSPSVAAASGAAPASVSTHAAQADDQYVNMFEKRGLSQAAQKSMPTGSGFGSRPNYRAAMPSPLRNPLERRQLYKLRQTFDQIAKLKKKTVSVNTENLPKDSLQRMVEEAISSGTKVTPVGSLKHAMKMAGYTSGEIKKAYRRWEHALFPGSYESAPMGPTRIR